VRSLLPEVAGPPWPPIQSVARPVESEVLWRLCSQPDFTHRRLAQAELHFMAADVVMVGDELQLDLLWTATSDDSCVMVGTDFHNDGDAYYSFAHTLPHAHLTHWECAFRAAGAAEEGLGHRAGAGALTVSISGFTHVTTCRVPGNSAAAQLLRAGTVPGGNAVGQLELRLTPTAPL